MYIEKQQNSNKASIHQNEQNQFYDIILHTCQLLLLSFRSHRIHTHTHAHITLKTPTRRSFARLEGYRPQGHRAGRAIVYVYARNDRTVIIKDQANAAVKR